jgi:hypothetical protein
MKQLIVEFLKYGFRATIILVCITIIVFALRDITEIHVFEHLASIFFGTTFIVGGVVIITGLIHGIFSKDEPKNPDALT